MSQISCIVPFFNEGDRISSTLSILSRSHEINEILAIDDNSTDNPSISRKNNVILLKNNGKKGKSHAIFSGLQVAKGNLILLIDADLKNLHIEEIDEACRKMKKNPSLDLLILKSTRATWITRLCRQDIVLSGTRIMKKDDLYEVFKTKPYGYQIETAINSYIIQNNKKHFYAKFSAYNTLRNEKIGILPALMGLLFLLKDVYSYQGYIPYLKQLLTFCHDELTQ